MDPDPFFQPLLAFHHLGTPTPHKPSGARMGHGVGHGMGTTSLSHLSPSTSKVPDSQARGRATAGPRASSSPRVPKTQPRGLSAHPHHTATATHSPHSHSPGTAWALPSPLAPHPSPLAPLWGGCAGCSPRRPPGCGCWVARATADDIAGCRGTLLEVLGMPSLLPGKRRGRRHPAGT